MPIIEVSPFRDTFSDETKTNVGSSYFSLSNDWFVGSELVIRTAPVGGGTLLILNIDYELSEFNSIYSVKIESNVYHQIQVIPIYQSTTLYFSGQSVKTKINISEDIALGDDVIKDNMIDWGSATGQVGAVDMPIVDADSRITATEVENALQELAGSNRTTETIKDNADDIANHDHDADYLGLTAKAADSELLDNHDSTYFSIDGHDHDADYLGLTAKAADSELLDNHDSTYFSIDGHTHDADYLKLVGGTLTGDLIINADLDVNGRLIELSNHYETYRWYFGGSDDLNWKKIADIVCPTGAYKACSIRVEITDAKSNHGSSSDVRPMVYYIAAFRSGAVQDDQDTGSVRGYSSAYVRLVKTSIGVYELQVQQFASWRHMEVTARIISSTSTVTWIDSPANGSTTGTIYYSSGPVFHGGLDADTLDTLHAAAFSLTGHNHDTTYLKLVGGTLSGGLSISAGGLTLLGGQTIGKFTVSTSAPSGGADNDLWFVREA